jgi:hypothetical protein
VALNVVFMKHMDLPIENQALWVDGLIILLQKSQRPSLANRFNRQFNAALLATAIHLQPLQALRKKPLALLLTVVQRADVGAAVNTTMSCYRIVTRLHTPVTYP